MSIPFNAEFHSKSKNKDGSWRLKKGADLMALAVYESSFEQDDLISADSDDMGSVCMYQNTSGGLFEVYGMRWNIDEIKEVPENLVDQKKFIFCVMLGCLTEV